MTQEQCRHCDFWVKPAANYCPNCGAAQTDHPSRQAQQADPSHQYSKLLGTILAAVVGLVLAALIFKTRLVVMVVAGGVLIPWLTHRFTRGSRKDAMKESSSLPLSSQPAFTALNDYEQTIQQRLEELTGRRLRLTEVRELIERESSAERRSVIMETLNRAETVLESQRKRYRLKLWELALVRWQNHLEPITGAWQARTYSEGDRSLEMVDSTREQGAAMLQEWEASDLAATHEGRVCIDRLREALDACDQLRQALLEQQAALAVQGISSLEETPSPIPELNEALESIDLFSARAEIGEFFSDFDALEEEYHRLQGEEEVEQLVEQKQG